jgi:hypothetical protein
MRGLQQLAFTVEGHGPLHGRGITDISVNKITSPPSGDITGYPSGRILNRSMLSLPCHYCIQQSLGREQGKTQKGQPDIGCP